MHLAAGEAGMLEHAGMPPSICIENAAFCVA